MHELDRIEAGGRARPIGNLSKEDGEAAIRAIRRGVFQKHVAKQLGVSLTTLRFSIGTWAIRYAVVPPAKDE